MTDENVTEREVDPARRDDGVRRRNQSGAGEPGEPGEAAKGWQRRGTVGTVRTITEAEREGAIRC